MKDPIKSDGKLTLSRMLGALDQKTAKSIEKKIKKLSKKKTVQKPPDEKEAAATGRKVAYSEVSKDISKWDDIVQENRKARQIKFPLDEQPDLLPTSADSIGDLIPLNKLEKQVNAILNSSDTVLRDNKVLTKAEEKYLKSISTDEAEERHRELQKMRVLLSSYAAKMRYQKKIKSKSYRRLLKKERLRSHMKRVETDSNRLTHEIEKLKLLRAQERASLKHRNTGKHSKQAKFRSRFDEEARIELMRKLREKPGEDNDDDDDDEDDADENVDDDDEDIEIPVDNALGSDETDSDSESEEDVDEADQKEEFKPIRTNHQVIVSSDPRPHRPKALINRIQDMLADDDIDSEADDEKIDDDDEQRKLMQEAFADDDVVAEFKKTKEKIADEEQPKVKDNFLPGWGSWAGPGIKKKRRPIKKAPRRPRKDDNLGHVIISESANGLKPAIDLPDKTITFVNQKRFRELIQPKVSTKMGARIEPMSKKVLAHDKIKWS